MHFDSRICRAHHRGKGQKAPPGEMQHVTTRRGETATGALRRSRRFAAGSASTAWCARAPMTGNTPVHRAHCKPWGLEGGRDSAGNAVSVRLGGKWKEDFPNAEVLVAQVAAGDAYRMRSSDGGRVWRSAGAAGGDDGRGCAAGV